MFWKRRLKSRFEDIHVVYDRERLTVSRSRSVLLVATGYGLLVLLLGMIGGVSGYVGMVLNLLTPLEFLLPVIAAAFGYRALLEDELSGESAVLRTFPLSRESYVGGILLARIVILLAVVLGPLEVIGIVVPFAADASSRFLLQRTTYSGVVLYLRFAVLTAAGAVVLFTIVATVSAAARQLRRAITLAVLIAVALAVGFDLLIIGGYAVDLFPPEWLPWLIAGSPVSAYRSLVLTLVVEPTATMSIEAGSSILSILGLLLWLFGSLGASIVLVWRKE